MSGKSFTSIGLLAMIGLASAAKQEVVSVLLPGIDEQPMVASIIGNDAAATTYLLQCPSGTEGDTECGLGAGVTLVSGPKTVGWEMESPYDDFNASVGCSLAGTTYAVCEVDMGGTNANSPGKATETIDKASDLAYLAHHPITITAGSLTSITGTPKTASEDTTGAVTDAKPSSTVSGVTATATGTEEATSETSGAEANASGEPTTGGMPQVTGNAKVIIGGAIALGAVLL